MPDWPIVRHTDPIVFSPYIPQSVGKILAGMSIGGTTQAWPTANEAIFIPFSVQCIVTVRKMFIVNGATLSGNVDVGIYNRNGTRLVSIGSTAQAGVSVIQEFDITDTLLSPGLYYLACAIDNGTATLDMIGPSIVLAMGMGIAEMASAFPLPATATFAGLTGTTRIPYIAATQRTLV